jgi:O-antigen/teichoic acid export membrane protein
LLSVEPAVAAVPSLEAPPPSKRSALKNSVITLGGFGASSGIRFISNLILTRLLLPEQFGVMAIVNVVILWLNFFSDFGIGPSIIQSHRGEDPTFLNTAWTIQVFRGIALWIIACLAAWPLARFYAQPQIFQLLPVAGLMAVAGGFESTRTYTLNRRLALGRLAAVEIISQTTSVLLMVVIAFKTRSIWSLVVGAVVGSFVKMTLTHTFLPGERNRLCFDAAARKSLFEFGRWIFLSTVLTCLSGQSDRLILGKLIPISRLGLYAIALNLAALPSQIIAQLTQRVLYPVIAEALRRGDHERGSIAKNHPRLLLVVAPVIGMGIVLSPPLVTLLYRAEYWEVGPIVACLTIGTWLGAISTSYMVTLLASGRPKFLAIGNFAKTVIFTSLIFLVYGRFGLLGVAVLVSLSEIGNLTVALIGCRRTGLMWKTDVAITLFVVAYGALCKVLYEGTFRLLHGSRVAGVAVVVTMTSVVVLRLARRLKLV